MVFEIGFFRSRIDNGSSPSFIDLKRTAIAKLETLRNAHEVRFNSLIPELSVSDFAKSLRFYVDVLGFKVEYDRPKEKFAFLSIENAQLMIEERNSNWETAALVHPYGRGINFQIEVSDLGPILERLRQVAHPLFVEPRNERYKVGDQFRDQRQFLVLDPDGYLLRFCQEMNPVPATILDCHES